MITENDIAEMLPEVKVRVKSFLIIAGVVLPAALVSLGLFLVGLGSGFLVIAVAFGTVSLVYAVGALVVYLTHSEDPDGA